MSVSSETNGLVSSDNSLLMWILPFRAGVVLELNRAFCMLCKHYGNIRSVFKYSFYCIFKSSMFVYLSYGYLITDRFFLLEFSFLSFLFLALSPLFSDCLFFLYTQIPFYSCFLVLIFYFTQLHQLLS